IINLAHAPGLRILYEYIDGGHKGDDQAFEAVLETSLEKIGLHERPGRGKKQAPERCGAALGDPFLGGERGVAVRGFQVLGERVAGVMEQVGFQRGEAAIDLDALVDVFADPAALAAIVEADLAVRIPAGMKDPAAHVLSEPRDGVGVSVGAVALDLPDL